MSSFIDYKGIQVIDPNPTEGTPARVFNDNFKTLTDGSVQVFGQFEATNFNGAFAHFNANKYNYVYTTADSSPFGGLFVALSDCRNLTYGNFEGYPNHCADCGCFCNGSCNSCCCCGTGRGGAPFVLCGINPQYFIKFSITLDTFNLNPGAIKYLTNCQELRLEEFRMTNSNLVVKDLNALEILNMHFTLEGSSTISISDLPSLESIWMSGDSYGGMNGLNDSNFALDFSTLPNVTGIALYDVGIDLSSTFIDNLFIDLANSVIANPRNGYFAIGGYTNSVTSASQSARDYLSGPGGWMLDYNS